MRFSPDSMKSDITKIRKVAFPLLFMLLLTVIPSDQENSIIQLRFAPNSRTKKMAKEILTRFHTNGSFDFPTPAFHGCDENDRHLCKFSNVCFSGADGMMVFDVPALQMSKN